MKNFIVVPLTAFALFQLLTADAIAQEFDQYGIMRNRGSATANASRRPFEYAKPETGQQNSIQQMFSGNKATTQQKPFRLFENVQMPKVNWPKIEWPKLNENGSLFARPSWLPERDPNAPNFFQRMNIKSKEFVDRATNWAQGKSNQLRAKQTASWDSIRQTMERIKAGQAESAPPMRSAQGSSGSIFK